MASVAAFLRLGRLRFLVGGFLLHALGIAMALYHGARFNPEAVLWGQIAITATQLMTHYSNDYFDLAADRANRTPTQWSGGSRVLPEGRLSPRVALAAALLLSVIVVIAALTLALRVQPAPLTLPLILTALALSWGYSAPPLRLHSRGLGEIATALIVPGLTPTVGFYLQAGRLDGLLLAALPLCALQFAMLLAIEFPDAAGDAAAGKRTLVVRLGGQKAVRLHNLALIAAYALLLLLAIVGLPPLVALLAAVTLPFTGWQFWRMARGDWSRPAQWERRAYWSVFLLMGMAAVQTAAFLLLLGLS